MTGKYCPGATAGPLAKAVLAVCVLVAGTASVQALDFNDVQNLIKNHVSENVIINMVQQDPNLTITQDQANQLRALGASENLVYSIRTSGTYTDTAATPVTTYPSTPVYPATTSSPVAAYPADGGAYAGTAYGDYDAYDGDYDDYEAEYYQQQQYQQQQLGTTAYPAGTVVQQAPVYDGTVTYVDPTIYQPAPQVIYQQAPTIVYDSPTYVYDRTPTWGFEINFGRDRDRWHRPPPPPPSHRPGPPSSHRPPSPPSHRPGGNDKPPPPSGHDKPPRPPKR